MDESGRKVAALIVEDDDELRQALTKVLAAEGFRVDVATNGAECITHVRRTPPDIVLLDLVLPWINGLEALAAIRDDERAQDLPVIVITGTPTQPPDLFGLGPVDILYKPIDSKSLVALMFSVLRRPASRSRKVQVAPSS